MEREVCLNCAFLLWPLGEVLVVFELELKRSEQCQPRVTVWKVTVADGCVAAEGINVPQSENRE